MSLPDFEKPSIYVSLGSTLQPVRVANLKTFYFHPRSLGDMIQIDYTPQKLTARTWKWMVGIRVSFRMAYFQVRTVSFREGNILQMGRNRQLGCCISEIPSELYEKNIWPNVYLILFELIVDILHYPNIKFQSFVAQNYTSFKSWLDALNVLLLVAIGTAVNRC